MKVFISWSGKSSKEFASFFKEWLVQIFPSGLEFFVSTEDIYKGENWFEIIKRNINDSQFSIICLTKSNLKSPWINFESGAIFSNHENAKVAPVLINIKEIEKNHPLGQFQMTCMNLSDITQLVFSLQKYGHLDSIEKKHLEIIVEKYFPQLEEHLVHQSLINNTIDHFEIYPPHINHVKNGKVFIGAPMDSLNESYEIFRTQVIKIYNLIKTRCKVPEIYYPGKRIITKKNFDGKGKAIYFDFEHLKESEYYIFIYPEKLVSSILVEVGYAIALQKKTILFIKSRDDLPFMLQEADKSIKNLKIYTYNNFEEIADKIKREKEHLLHFA